MGKSFQCEGVCALAHLLVRHTFFTIMYTYIMFDVFFFFFYNDTLKEEIERKMFINFLLLNEPGA